MAQTVSTPWNDQGIVQTLQRQIRLGLGYEIDPIIISDTTAQVAQEGACFYKFRAISSAGIDEILGYMEM